MNVLVIGYNKLSKAMLDGHCNRFVKGLFTLIYSKTSSEADIATIIQKRQPSVIIFDHRHIDEDAGPDDFTKYLASALQDITHRYLELDTVMPKVVIITREPRVFLDNAHADCVVMGLEGWPAQTLNALRSCAKSV